ncbi:MAG: hypothetical protein HY647_02595 [Acidobacteria bacterium]|nr:hypothetical protein [Acidobacteriota bacterium]
MAAPGPALSRGVLWSPLDSVRPGVAGKKGWCAAGVSPGELAVAERRMSLAEIAGDRMRHPTPERWKTVHATSARKYRPGERAGVEPR